ncbi:MAG: T9SS type A sorting domain-containing protein [Leeuwenhoekiella sp.]
MRKFASLGISLALLFVACQNGTELNTTNSAKQVHKESEGSRPKKGIEKIAEYLAEIKKPIGAEKSSYEPGYLMKEYLKAPKKSSSNRRGKASVTAWEERGPANVPGRTRDVKVSPTDPNKWYAGTVGGGLWITEDAGQTWENATDFKVPNLATSTVALSENVPGTIYLGTGEPYFNLDAITGIGILKSTDDGRSWEYLDNTANFGDIGRLVVDPNDADHVVAGTSRGVYVTTNGGVSWKRAFTFGIVQDVVADPTNFNILYGGVRAFGIIKSTDGGQSWKTIFNRNEFNSNHVRFEIDVFPSEPERIIASVYSSSGASTAINTDFYLSKDSGDSFILLGTNSNPEQANLLTNQGWYDNIVMAHPTDVNSFYVGGVSLYKVGIQGIGSQLNFTYNQIASGNSINRNVHVDQHGLTYTMNSNNQFRIIASNDGGVYSTSFSSNPGTLEGSWSNTAIGLNSTQYYGADKNNGTDNYIGGAQDNGTQIYTAFATASPDSNYQRIIGGDGFEVIWHYTDPNKFIGGSQYNNFFTFSNGSFFSASHEDSGEETSPFYSKITNANNNPDVIFSPGIQGVWRSADFGLSWELTPLGASFTSSTTSSLDVVVSVADPNVVWAGSAMQQNGTRKLQVSEDNGQTFVATPAYIEPRTSLTHNYSISGLETSPTARERAYALFSGQVAAKVLKTENLGQTWTDISGFSEGIDRGFPNVPTYCLIEMPFDKNNIWVGTDLGIVETTDGGDSWALLDGLPAVSVWQMKIVNDQVVIATHGRGIWTATVSELSGYEPPAYFAPPRVNEIYQESFTQQNAIIDYDVPFEDIEKVDFFVNDDLVRTVTSNISKGANSLKIDNLPEGLHTLGIRMKGSDGKQSIIREQEFAIIDFDPIRNAVQVKTFENDDVFTFGSEFLVNNVGGKVTQPVLRTSPNPYLPNTEYRTIIKTPMKLTPETGLLKYEDAAIVEPGDATSIYDYVTIEASTDLRRWVTLDQYDARRFPAWLAEYNKEGNASIEDDLFREQEIDLLDFFNVGDEIAFRFRLITDPGAESWGWAIRSINKDAVLSVDGAGLSKDIAVFPTVSDGTFNVRSGQYYPEAKLSVYDISGRLIHSENIDLKNENHSVSLTGAQAGNYFVRINTPQGSTIKRIIIK